MFVQPKTTPWWKRYEIVIHFNGTQLRTRCGVNAPLPQNGKWKLFMVCHAPAELWLLAKSNEAAEVHFDGVKYSVRSYRDAGGGEVQFRGDPIGTVGVTVNAGSAKPSIQEQVLEALRSEPSGMTARQLEEKLKCSRRAVFAALAALSQSNQVTKDGALYRAVD